MKNFNFYAPTEVVFGDQSEEQVALLVKKYGGTKVLVWLPSGQVGHVTPCTRTCVASYVLQST